MTNGASAATAARPGQATGGDNVRVWQGQPGHYEVWYTTLNHRPSRTGFWIRYTMEAPIAGHGDPYAQLWFAAFDAADPSRGFALNRKLPIAEMRASASPFEVRIGDSLIADGVARGSLAGAGHQARWDLTWKPAATTHRHLPGLIYRTKLGDTKVLSPSLDAPFSGTIEIDGRTLTLDGEPGGQTHLWGRKHAHAWAWGHCNAFEDRPGAAFETLTVQLARRGIVLPPLTLLTLYLDGETLRFTDFADTLFTRGRWGTARYDFRAIGPEVRIEGGYSCRPEDMTVAEYSDPDGDPSYCANTEVADLRITVYRRSGWLGRWVEQARLRAPETGHFEVAGRCPDPAITRRHVTI